MHSELRTLGVALLMLLAFPLSGNAAGTLTPKNATHKPVEIHAHHVNVVINNGFAQTEILQTFYNPNDHDLEAIYAFPAPKSASLSEFTIYAGEQELHGEVVERKKGEEIYREERDKGNDSGLATKNGYQTFEFAVSPVRANATTRIRAVYYQPLEIDTGVGRYLYPLEDGGTDIEAERFWTSREEVNGPFSINLELKSAWPVVDVRTPGFESDATVKELGPGHYNVHIEQQNAALNRDFVLYYRLADGLPGRVEVVSYRADAKKPGTFMMVVTPGIDLQPLSGGADYVFVLDVSGSMAGKIHTLAAGVNRAIGEMKPGDRVRVVTFNDRAREITRDWVDVNEDNVDRLLKKVSGLQSSGGTNLYDGLALGLKDLDDDRATSVVLVTDAVTNTGIIDPVEFHDLLKQYDVRVFGFLLGNSANWPLMRTISAASGGFSTGVSNADDILGQIMLAKSKITHESLHDAEIRVRGAKVFDTTDESVRKIYRGQQMVLFGRYDGEGEATVELKARLTGEDKTYKTQFSFPEVDTDNPELERLWALRRIEEIEDRMNAGLEPVKESEDAIQSLGVDYQLVTDYTAMLVLSDEAFDRHGIDRRNRARVQIEREAQARRANQPIRSYQVDQKRPMFGGGKAPGLGGGAIDPVTGVMALGLAGAALASSRRRRDGTREDQR